MGTNNIDKTVSLELYRRLYLSRRAEQGIIEHYENDEMKSPMHMSMGQEAIVAGVCCALSEQDQVLGTYRSHALFLNKTDDLDMFFAEMYGKETGTAKGKSGSMHLSDYDKGMLSSSAIIASGIPVAVGAALANKMQGNEKIVAVFFGDGATDAGVFWESLNYACLENLKVLFICEDNGLAVHTDESMRAGYDSKLDVVKGFRCNIYDETGTDVEVVYNLVKEAIEITTKENKPAFIRLKYHRYLEHVGINEDYDDGYRVRDEYERWLLKDSIKLQRRKLESDNSISEAEILEVENMIDERVISAIEFAKNSKFSDPDKILHEDVFV